MNYSAYFFAGLLAVLGGSNVANAVCSGSVVAVGTPAANAATGLTQCTHAFVPTAVHPPRSLARTDKVADNVYDSTCKTVQTLQISTVPGICDSRYFLCFPGTTTIREYDDPTSGVSYLCTPDATSESCGSDKVSYCVSLFLAVLNFAPEAFCAAFPLTSHG